jgi:hypothetical protein
MGFTHNLGTLAQGVFSDSSLNIGIGGSPSGSYKFEITGTAKISSTLLVSGVTTFGSTLSNGTYTYTLPSATGTLALTSDIHSAVTLSAIGSTANANGATLTGQVLNLQPADASFGGVVTTGTQTFAGAKTFTSALSGTSATFLGNVGIGTTSPSALLNTFSASTSTQIIVTGADTTNQRLEVTDGTVTNRFGIFGRTNGDAGVLGTQTNHPLVFNTNSTERMRITSGGDVLVGTTTADVNTVGAQLRSIGLGIFVRSEGSCLQLNRLTSDGTIASFRTSDVERGSISISGTVTSYNVTSDYRLKEDFKEVKGLEKVQSIKVYDYKWKSFDSRMDGVLAHELAEILPYAVFGHKDEVDEDGNDKMQGVDYSKLVPVIVKAIQELKAEIEGLKTLIK